VKHAVYNLGNINKFNKTGRLINEIAWVENLFRDPVVKKHLTIRIFLNIKRKNFIQFFSPTKNDKVKKRDNPPGRE